MFSTECILFLQNVARARTEERARSCADIANTATRPVTRCTDTAPTVPQDGNRLSAKKVTILITVRMHRSYTARILRMGGWVDSVCVCVCVCVFPKKKQTNNNNNNSNNKTQIRGAPS